MLSSLLSTIKHDSILLGCVTFAAVFLIYLVVMQVNVYGYAKRHETQPLHYKFFRLYSKSLIKNAPSKSEKKFYNKTNKITYFFNSLILTVFAVFIFIWLK